MFKKEKNEDYLQGLGANERAILERIPVIFLRKAAAGIVRKKIKLQFSGWLQYLLPVIFVLIFSFTGGIAQLLNARFIALPMYALGALCLFIIIFDLITVKYRIRFPEALSKRKKLDLFDLMRERRSCRSYQIRKLTKPDFNELMKSVRVHTNEFKFGDTPIRFEYISSPLTVWPVVNATEFIIAIAPKDYNRVAIIDIGRSLQKIVMDATRMGLGTCWIGPGADHNSIIQSLENKFDCGKDQIICICAVGYKSKYIPLFIRIFNAQVNRRLPFEKLFFSDTKLLKPVDLDSPDLKRFGRNYEICQWAPSSYNGQTTRIIINKNKTGEIKRFDFCTTTASRYYAPISVGIWCTNWELGCEAQNIKGHFVILTEEEMAVDREKSNLRFSKYDVSWVVSSLYPFSSS